MNLLIVESPAKCSKIKSFLGSTFTVEASYGHVRSIPVNGMNVNESTFEPNFAIDRKKSETVKKLKALAIKADKIYLATDPDREGEAISWHLYELLDSKCKKKCVRVTFNEISKKAVTDAVNNPRDIDMNLVSAQKARQVLDRLIGFRISPVVWRQVCNGTSAGRVQSIALKLICDRKKEIDAFKSDDYWFIDAILRCSNGEFSARVITKEKNNSYKEEKLATDEVALLKVAKFTLDRVEKKVKTMSPYPPFDTASLQKSCSSLFGWSASKTMQVAQTLYETGHCFLPGVLIPLEDGSVQPIENLMYNRKILSFDSNYNQILIDSIPIKLKYKGIIQKINYGANLEISATSEHIFPVYDSLTGDIIEKRASELLKTDYFLKVKPVLPYKNEDIKLLDILRLCQDKDKLRIKLSGDNSIIKKLKTKILSRYTIHTYYKYATYNICPIDLILEAIDSGTITDNEIENRYISIGYQCPSAKHIKIPIRLNYKFFHLMGLYYSDGCMSSEHKFNLSALLKKNPRKIAIEKYVDLHKKIINIYGEFGLLKEKKRNLRLTTGSVVLKRIMSAMGLVYGKKSKKIEIINIAYKNTEFLKSFLAGLWDGDGHFTIKKNNGIIDSIQAGYTSTSKKIIHQIRILLGTFNINSYVHLDKRKNYSYQLKLSTYDTDKFYELIKNYSIIKSRVYESIIEQVKRKGNRIKSKNTHNKPLSEVILVELKNSNIKKFHLQKKTGIDVWNFFRKNGKLIPEDTINLFSKILKSDKLDKYNLLTYISINSIVPSKYEGDVFCFQTNNGHFLFDDHIMTHNCTYLRTDSFNISKEAVNEARDFISKMGCNYLPEKPCFYSKKSSAASQEAHECIRAVHVEDTGLDLSGDDKRLYDLIRARFLACQMTPMLIDTVTYHIKASSGHDLIANGQVIKFDGWFRIYPYSKIKDEMLPEAKDGDNLTLIRVESSKHTTQPPPHYNDGSLVEKMESEGIGRPSTRAAIFKAIRDKGYVDKDGKAFIPTDLGTRICDFLAPNFSDFFMDLKFTAGLEEDLDLIADAKKDYLGVVKPVYDFMMKKISLVKSVKKDPVQAGAKCPICKTGDIVEKMSRFGKFFSCNRYPECKSILKKNEDGTFSEKGAGKAEKVYGPDLCHLCNSKMVERSSKYGKFYGCEKYPKCHGMRKEDGTPAESKKKKWGKKK